jgi:hypothetical protein
MRQMLLDQFLTHSCLFGFFLHSVHLRQRLLLPASLGDVSRPSPGLANAIYLIGSYLSDSQSFKVYEPIFLQRALQHIASEVSSGVGPDLIHTIQAEVILTNYFFRHNRFLEAEVHINTAVSLSLSCDLHKLRSSRSRSPRALGFSTASEIFLPAAASPIEEGERICAFWAVFSLQRLLTVSLRKQSNTYGILDSPATEIDTPWPQEMSEYQLVRHHFCFRFSWNQTLDRVISPRANRRLAISSPRLIPCLPRQRRPHSPKHVFCFTERLTYQQGNRLQV